MVILNRFLGPKVIQAGFLRLLDPKYVRIGRSELHRFGRVGKFGGRPNRDHVQLVPAQLIVVSGIVQVGARPRQPQVGSTLHQHQLGCIAEESVASRGDSAIIAIFHLRGNKEDDIVNEEKRSIGLRTRLQNRKLDAVRICRFAKVGLKSFAREGKAGVEVETTAEESQSIQRMATQASSTTTQGVNTVLVTQDMVSIGVRKMSTRIAA